MIRPTLLRCSIAALAVLALSGCASGEPSPEAVLQNSADEAAAAGSQENADAMSDGELTEDEYYDAARRFQTCYSDAGVVIEGPVLSPVDSLTLEWVYPDTYDLDENGEAAVEQCNSQWIPVAAAYSATHDSVMDQALRVSVITCMQENGYEMAGDESSVVDFVGEPEADGGQQRTQAEHCIIDGARVLFPDLPQVTVSY